MDAEAVQMFSAPVEGQLENFMELGDAGFAADQEAPPYQGADIPKDYSKLIKFCHLRSLPDHARNLHNLSPRNLPLSLVVQFGGLIGLFGSRLGTNHGFTQRGCTGVMVPVVWFPKVPEFEGLNASAVAVALTLFPLFPNMREKNVGRFARVTSTVTTGFTPTAAGNPEQSDDVLPPAEYVTVMDPAAIPQLHFAGPPPVRLAWRSSCRRRRSAASYRFGCWDLR